MPQAVVGQERTANIVPHSSHSITFRWPVDFPQCSRSGRFNATFMNQTSSSKIVCVCTPPHIGTMRKDLPFQPRNGVQ
jgi:hypothetical protein